MANVGIICKIIICTLLCTLADVFGGSCGFGGSCQGTSLSETCYSDFSCDIDLKDPDILAMIGGIEKLTDGLMSGFFNDPNVAINALFCPVCIYALLSLINALLLPKADSLVFQSSLRDVLNVLKVKRTRTIQAKQSINVEAATKTAIFVPDQSANLVNAAMAALIYNITGESQIITDFATDPDGAVKKINDWVSAVTGTRLVLQLSTPLPKATIAFLTNTLFLTAKWSQDLFTEQVDGDPTYLSENHKVQILNAKKRLFSFTKENSYSAFELQFQEYDYTLIIIKTMDNVKPEDFVKTFNMAEYKSIIGGLKEAQVQLDIPTFAISWSADLTVYLQKLNLKDIGLNSPNLENFIKQVNVKNEEKSAFKTIAAIKINEAGILANTFVTENLVPYSLNFTTERLRPFEVKRPFLAIVRHLKTNLPLFVTFVQKYVTGQT